MACIIPTELKKLTLSQLNKEILKREDDINYTHSLIDTWNVNYLHFMKKVETWTLELDILLEERKKRGRK